MAHFFMNFSSKTLICLKKNKIYIDLSMWLNILTTLLVYQIIYGLNKKLLCK